MSDVPREPYEDDLPELTNEAKSWAALCHLAALTGLFTAFGFFLGPLVVWLVKRNDHPFIDDQGREALNFQLSYFIYIVILCCTLIGIPVAIILFVADIVLTIVAAINASDGVAYRYPLTMRIIG